MDNLFKLSHVGIFVDDIVVTGETHEEHMKNLHVVFQILNDCGLRIAKEKCT